MVPLPFWSKRGARLPHFVQLSRHGCIATTKKSSQFRARLLGLANHDACVAFGIPFKPSLFCVKRNAGLGGPAPLQWETYGGAWSAAYSVPLERRGAVPHVRTLADLKIPTGEGSRGSSTRRWLAKVSRVAAQRHIDL